MDAVSAAPGAQAEIVEIIEPLRAYVRAHARAGTDADDVVQETLARVLGTRDRLTPGSALAYAIVVARNLLTDGGRETARARRLGHRVIDLTEPGSTEEPEAAALRREERLALGSALAGVPAGARTSLLAHVLDDVPVTAIADADGDSSGAVAARLARTRARLRLDYVLALRGVALPTARCRPILLALSAGDTRRQRALRAGNHLITCATCAEVSQPLLQRRSALVAVLPWLGIGPAIGLLRYLRQSPGQAAAVAGGAVAVGAVATAGVVLVMAPADPPAGPAAQVAQTATGAPVATSVPGATAATVAPASAGELVRVADGKSVLSAPGELARHAGEQVRARRVPVEAVAADEGFWVGTGEQRVWVQIRTGGRESPQTVRAGSRVSFTGEIHSHDADFAHSVGVGPAEGAAQLTREGAHLSVISADLTVEAP